MPDTVLSTYSRLFLIEGGAAPDHAPVYKGLWKAGAVSWDQGDITSVYTPDPNKYRAFRVVEKVQGEPSNPEIPVTARFNLDLSDFLRLARNQCDNDIHIHFGKCGDPRSFNTGWSKIAVLLAAKVSNYSTEDLGALQPDESAAVNEEITLVGEDYFELAPMSFARKAESILGYEVIDVIIGASALSCETECTPCQNIIALVDAPSGGKAKVVFSSNGGDTWSQLEITTLDVDDNVDAIAIIGNNVVVISNEDDSLHWCNLEALLNGTGTWQQVTTGFVGAGSPNAIFSAAPTFTWIVGDGGYIYFVEDPTSQVEVQDAGSATTEILNAIHGIDEDNVIAVGNNNAVVYTANGGNTWSSVVGPRPGVNLNAVQMLAEGVWLIGTNDGRLYYTKNYGTSWAEKTFPGSGAGAVRDFAFVNSMVGFMAHVTAAPAGRILRTLDGGYSWYVLPEGTGSMPTNERFNALAVCPENANLVYAGGLEVSGTYTDGILVEGAA